ncbi:MAG: copper amine oxidase N-terminal domain-containing protein [Solirubrobacterales bacterium]
MNSHKKLVSLVMAVMFCITFLAPVLVAPAPAMAAATYTVLKSQTIADLGVLDPIKSVIVQIDVPTVSALSANDRLTLHLPSDLSIKTWNGTAIAATAPLVAFNVYDTMYSSPYGRTDIRAAENSGLAMASNTTYGGVSVIAPSTLDNGTVNAFYWNSNLGNKMAYGRHAAFRAYAISLSTVEIQMTSSWPVAVNGAGRFQVNFNQVYVTSAIDGDITVNMATSNSSGFTNGSVVIGKYQTGGKGTVTMMKSVKTMSTGTNEMDTIMIQETVKNSIATSELIKLKLPTGFVWDSTKTAVIVGSWAFENHNKHLSDTTGLGGLAAAPKYADGDRSMLLQIANLNDYATKGEGRIFIGGTVGVTNYMPWIKVDDESVAKKGEVQFTISSDKGNVTEQTVTIANYKDYSAEVTEVSSKDVVAGAFDTELGTFKIKEGLKSSVLPARTVKFTLPAGVKWDWTLNAGARNLSGSPITKKLQTGGDWTTATPTLDSTRRVLTITTAAAGTTTAGDINFEKAKVVVSPDFTGDVVLEVGGTAGVTGKAKIAVVKAPVEVTVDKTPDLIIGAQAQAIGTILIKESKKEALKSSGATIRLNLPDGSKWASKGTITVSEGDVGIDKSSTSGATLDIVLKSTSTVPSTIKIEGATVTPDRTVPEGDYKVDLMANFADCAVVEKYAADSFNVTKVSSTTIGKVVTPAPQQTMQNTGANGSFTVGQKFMIVAGQYKTLEVAPYIKSGRTYVPIRNLADALGATTAWDAATQKVTITKGTKTVELTIGQMTAKVNGADQAMDVAPEITGGRTMLPARYVAEGLGFTVTFDDATKQVVFSAQ